MKEKSEEKEKVKYIRKINGVENKVRLEAEAAMMRLNAAMLKIGDSLLRVTTEIEFDPKMNKNDNSSFIKTTVNNIDSKKDKMVICASSIGQETETLGWHVNGLSEKTFELIRRIHEIKRSSGGEIEPLQIDKIPFGAMGIHSTVLFNKISNCALEIENLKTLTEAQNSADKDLTLSCCELVIDVCEVEKMAVTEYQWDTVSPDGMSPDGMIGHTYDILCACDRDYGTKYAEGFKPQFQGDANGFLTKAIELENKATALKNERSKSSSPDQDQANTAAGYLDSVIDLLHEASNLIERACRVVASLIPT